MTGILVLLLAIGLLCGFLAGSRRLERYLHRCYPSLGIVETRQSWLIPTAPRPGSEPSCDRTPTESAGSRAGLPREGSPETKQGVVR